MGGGGAVNVWKEIEVGTAQHSAAQHGTARIHHHHQKRQTREWRSFHSDTAIPTASTLCFA